MKVRKFVFLGHSEPIGLPFKGFFKPDFPITKGKTFPGGVIGSMQTIVVNFVVYIWKNIHLNGCYCCVFKPLLWVNDIYPLVI